MPRPLLALALAGLLAAGPGLAATTPQPLAVDPRIKQFVYDENTVYQLDVHMRFITTIRFMAGEVVESIQVGDSASWQIVRLNRGDVVSVKPLIENAHTNMTVLTDRRIYTFELRAKRGRPGSAALNYVVGFSYPSETVTEFEGASFAASSAPRSYDYHVAGEAPFQPVEVYDDERQTVFRFAPNVQTPAIFRVDEQGRESVVNSRRAGDLVIVDGVSDRWTARIGDQELCIASGRAASDRRSGAVAAASLRGGRDD